MQSGPASCAEAGPLCGSASNTRSPSPLHRHLMRSDAVRATRRQPTGGGRDEGANQLEYVFLVTGIAAVVAVAAAALGLRAAPLFAAILP